MNKIVVGSRDSVLAVMQTELVIAEIKKQNPTMEIELKTFKTTGDKILNKTLDKIGGKGLFVKELDQALMDGVIDIAVHSLKDVPMEENPELPIVAVTRRGDPRDVLVLPEGADEETSLDRLTIGSSSFRRRLQLQALYQETKIENIRGNIQTRLRKLDEGQFDGIILAAAGLKRANLEERISRIFSVEEMLPAAGQGILVIQARKDLDCSFLVKVSDEDTMVAAEAERGFVRALNGGCTSPVAAYTVVNREEITITGLYYKESTGEFFKETKVGKRTEARACGEAFAREMKQNYGE